MPLYEEHVCSRPADSQFGQKRNVNRFEASCAPIAQEVVYNNRHSTLDERSGDMETNRYKGVKGNKKEPSNLVTLEIAGRASEVREERWRKSRNARATESKRRSKT